MRYTDVLTELESWRTEDGTALISPVRGDADYGLADYIDFVTEYEDAAIFNSALDEHLTASLIVLNEDFTRTLLVFHKKAERWIQLGGHLEESDASLLAAAMREGREEAGIEGFTYVTPVPSDIDRHQLGDGFGDDNRHWDVAFAAVISDNASIAVSDESAGLRWFAIEDVDAELRPRIDAAIAASRANVAKWANLMG